MNDAFYIGATGLNAQQKALEVIADNIANMNTPAFKRREVRFSEIIASRTTDVPVVGTPSTSGVSGVAVIGAPTDFSQGDLRATGRALDLAIDGPGFIEVMGAGGRTLLWRGGELSIGADGLLSTKDGLALKALITVPEGATDLAIGEDGRVTALTAAGRREEIGKIDIVLTRTDAALQPVGGSGVYAAGDEADLMAADPAEDGAGRFRQGFIESANLQLSDEMVLLMLTQRAFAASAQVVQAGDQLMALANNLRR